MWQKLAGCAVAIGMCTGTAWAAMDARPAVPDQKHTSPEFINTREDAESPRGHMPGPAADQMPQHTLTQKGPQLPPYINRRGEVSLIGPSGLFRETSAVRVDLRPRADHLVSIRMTW